MKTEAKRILLDRNHQQIRTLINFHTNAIPYINAISNEFKKLELGVLSSEIFINLLNQGVNYCQQLNDEKIKKYFESHNTDIFFQKAFMTNITPEYNGLEAALDKFRRYGFNGYNNIQLELFQFDEMGNAILTKEKENVIIEDNSYYIDSEKDILVYEKAQKIIDALNDFNSGLPNNVKYSPSEIKELFKEDPTGGYSPGSGILYAAKFYYKS